MKQFIKIFIWFTIVLVGGVDFHLYAQVPPPVAVPIDGLSGAVIVVIIGAGLAARKYHKNRN